MTCTSAAPGKAGDERESTRLGGGGATPSRGPPSDCRWVWGLGTCSVLEAPEGPGQGAGAGEAASQVGEGLPEWGPCPSLMEGGFLQAGEWLPTLSNPFLLPPLQSPRES